MCFIKPASIDFNNIEQIKSILTNIASFEGREVALIRSDLQVNKFNRISKFFWTVFAKHFNWSRKCFYGVDLTESKKNLNAIRIKIAKINDLKLNQLYAIAEDKFNNFAPKHKVNFGYQPIGDKSPLKLDEVKAKEPIVAEIEKEVKIFLAPYLAGVITPENEPADKKRLTAILLEKYPDDKRIETILAHAFNIYIQESMNGFIALIPPEHGTKSLWKPNEIRIDLSQIPEENIEQIMKKGSKKLQFAVRYAMFVQALKDAIRKDFPGLHVVSNAEIEKKAEVAYIAVAEKYFACRDRDAADTDAVMKKNDAIIAELQALNKAPMWKTQDEMAELILPKKEEKKI